ncbi:hypothetical protein ANAEL_04935 [Anaerolineales bacterium]|nr:hypothetical protein ANAEL_04935 [Anaerolineales bacterium]
MEQVGEGFMATKLFVPLWRKYFAGADLPIGYFYTVL